MPLTISLVGNRWSVGRAFIKYNNQKNLGVITDVKLTRLKMFTWHLEFKTEYKDNGK